MKYYCAELNKEFNSLPEMHSALVRNEKSLISLKTAQLHKSAEKGQLSIKGSYLKADIALKANLDLEDGFIYPIINTTRYMDSHKDVHFDGIWKKTLKEQKGNIFYVDNHSFKVDDVIAWKEDVEVFTKMISWSLVGKEYDGETEALIFKIAKDKLKKQTAIDVINEKRDVENSVSMFYVKMILGVNSEEKDHKKNKEYFDKRSPEIVNKDVVDEYGYFWGIEEAKIHREGSMVLAGSNDTTAIITVEDKQSIEDDNKIKKGTLKYLSDNFEIK